VKGKISLSHWRGKIDINTSNSLDRSLKSAFASSARSAFEFYEPMY
jgi:hypothetical protein